MKKLLKGIALVISVLMLIISIGVLGKDEWLVTQIATISYPALFSWVLIISLLFLAIGLYQLAKEKYYQDQRMNLGG